MEAEPPEPREQARQIREVIKRRQSSLREGDCWYVLSMRWWDLWKDYTRYGEDLEAMEAEDAAVGSDTLPLQQQLSRALRDSRPPAIDNAELMAAPGGNKLRGGLQEYSDFALLHEDAWQLLVRWYGGGPALKRMVVSVGAGASSELRVELYPLWLTVYKIGCTGQPIVGEPIEVCFARSGRARDLLGSVCSALCIADVSEDAARLWLRASAPTEAEQQVDWASLDGWERIPPGEKTLEEVGIADGAILVLEQSKSTKHNYSYRTIIEWPFFRRMRLEYKKRAYKDPRDPSVRLAVDDAIDAAVEVERESYGHETTKILTWYPATVVAEEEDRVLVQFHNREKPRTKLPPILTDGGWLSEKQLTAEVKAALETVFKRYATDGRIGKAAMRGLMSCATNMLVQEDSWQVSDLLTTYGDGQSVELEGFQKYWRQKAVTNSYWLEDELGRLFDRVGATLAPQSEEEKLLSQGREWIPRNSGRLAQYRSNDYPHTALRAKRGFRDFRRYDNLDVSFGGEWKQVEVQEVNWEEMTVLVQTKEATGPNFRVLRDWFPMESDRLAEYQTKSLEVVDEEPAPLLARSSSRGGVCFRPGACGLQNLGNTCFMNSTLQCLSNCSALRAFFTGGPEQKPPFLSQLSSSPLSLNGRLAREFSRLLCNMWSNTNESCAPAELKALIGQKRPEFSGYQQQDAQELLIFLLDGLHEDVNRAEYPRVVVPEVESDGRPDDVVAQEAWTGHLKRNNSRIVELFQFQIRSEVECPVCGNVSVTFDPIMYLSLPVPKPPHSVSLTVVPNEYPRAPMCKLDVVVPRGATFEELEQRLWAQLQRQPSELPSCFVFADVWSDRVFKTFSETHKISEIQQGDNVYALEVRLAPGAAEEKHTFVSVLFRKQQKSVYTTFSYDRIAPPRILGVPKGATNVDVHAKLTAMANDLLGQVAQASSFELVTQIDTYASTRGELLLQDDARFSITPQQHVGVNFLDTDAIATLQASLPKVVTHHVSDAAGSAVGGSTVALQQCLQKNAEREQLSEEDSVYCRKCKEHRRCWKRIELWTLPSQLIIHLKRFGRDRIDGPLTKITTPVDFPLELDLNPYLARPHSGTTYDLCGVVNHHGGLGGGHYTAHALVMPVDHDGAGQPSAGGEWCAFNDSRVSRSSANEVDYGAGYILFYQRREQRRL